MGPYQTRQVRQEDRHANQRLSAQWCQGAQPNSTLLNMGVLASEEQCRACLEKIIDCAADTLEDLYSMGGMIGEGRFSKVYAGVSERAVETASPREPWRGRG